MLSELIFLEKYMTVINAECFERAFEQGCVQNDRGLGSDEGIKG